MDSSGTEVSGVVMLSVVDSDADDVTEVSCDETGWEALLPAQPLSRETRIKVHIKVVFFIESLLNIDKLYAGGFLSLSVYHALRKKQWQFFTFV